MTPEGPSFITNMFPIVLVIVIFYFLIIRPQQQQEKQRQKMLAELAQGDKIITTGGVHGVVDAVQETEVIVRVAEKVKLTIQRTAVAAIIKDTSAQPPKGA
ncbi:MAG: preprotein translocase subunit YajC [Elusimicrobiaceae bacterium]|nr:preprotein translocase subunit YajC [Elusimicrobiaceae bacterium]